MSLRIPGIEVEDVSKVVPDQHAPAAVIGLLGITESVPEEEVGRAGRRSRFMELFGRASVFSMPEADQAVANGATELVVVPVQDEHAVKAKLDFCPGSVAQAEITIPVEGEGATEALILTPAEGVDSAAIRVKVMGKKADLTFDLSISDGTVTEKISVLTLENIAEKLTVESKLVQAEKPEKTVGRPKNGEYKAPAGGSEKGNPICVFTARAAGTWGNRIRVVAQWRSDKQTFDLVVSLPGSCKEIYRDLQFVPEGGKNRHPLTILNEQSALITVEMTGDAPAEDVVPRTWSDTLTGGTDAAAEAYEKALIELNSHPDVTLVLPSVQSMDTDRLEAMELERLTAIYTAVNKHCQEMSRYSHNRIGFGQVPGIEEKNIISNAQELAENLVSERLVLVAPGHVLGATVGRISRLPVFEAPTGKKLVLDTEITPVFAVESQHALLKEKVVPVVGRRQTKAITLIRGITTAGGQINVRRTADFAIRGVRAIGEGFLGRLNNKEVRTALRQKLTAFLLGMEKEGAILPSMDGRDPAFKVNVYAGQADDPAFEVNVHKDQADLLQGIVRVELAVRPARAIDYIYATVLVQD
jgi:hypothetical protein